MIIEMKESQAVLALLGMAHEHRMRIFKMLMAQGPSGLSSGDVASRLGVGRSNVSFHLSNMERSGLLRSRRVHRNRFYAVDVDGVRDLLVYLTEACCDWNPKARGPLLNGAAAVPAEQGDEA